jgi:hypothetical protein
VAEIVADRGKDFDRFQSSEAGKEESFLISLDDMFLFPRGWAFTSVTPGIGKEPLTK